MAQEIAYNIKVNTDGSLKSLGQLEDEFEKLNKQIKEVPVNSKEFKVLNKQLALTGKEIKNVELGFESLDNEQVASEMGSVSGAIGDVSAAFILLGDDSETMQEVAKNIEFAMGISIGFKGAIEGVSSARKLLNNSTILSTIATKANTAANVIAGVAQSAYTLAVGASTGATKLFRLALISTGIGAIIIGIGLLIANFDKVTEAVSKAVKWFGSLGEGIKLTLSIIFPFVGIIRLVNAALISMGVVESETTKVVNKARDARVKKLKEETDKTIKDNGIKIKSIQKYEKDVSTALDLEIRKRKASGLETETIELKKLKVLKTSSEQQIKLIEENIKAITKSSKDRSRILFNFELSEQEVRLEAQKKKFAKSSEDLDVAEIAKATKQKAYTEAEGKAREEAVKKKEDARRAERQKVRYEREKQSIQDAKDALKLAEEAEIARQEERASEIDRERAQNLELAKIRADDQELELIELKLKYASKFELAEGNAELERLLQMQLNDDIGAINERFRDQEFAAQKELTDKENSLSKEEKDSKVALAKQGADLIVAIADFAGKSSEANAKKAFAVNKAYNLAEAGIDGTKAVLSTFAGTAGGPVIKGAAAALAGTFAALNIAKIASAKFQGGSGGGQVAIPTTSAGAGGTTLNPLSNTTTDFGGDTKVFVVEQDISNTQNKVKVNENIATL